MKQQFSVLKTSVKPSAKELALAMLYQCGLTTVEERRARGRILLEAQIPDSLPLRGLVPKLQKMQKQVLGREILLKPRIHKIPRRSWDKVYQQYLKPFPLDPKNPDSLWIDPSGKNPKKLDPKKLTIMASLAFGTGTHPTTRMAALLMLRALRENPKAPVLDVGCGTAILGMIARRSGCSKAVGVDNDPEALGIARENLRLNRVTRLNLAGDLRKIRGKYPIVVANIILKTLCELQAPLLARLKSRGYLVVSGLLYRDVPELIRVYKTLKLIQRLNQNGWSALLFQRR